MTVFFCPAVGVAAGEGADAVDGVQVRVDANSSKEE